MAYKISAQSETLELLMAYRQKPCVHLRNRIVNANVGLVRKVAHRIAHQSSVPFEDLEQVGYIGLITATERFDPTQGYAFSSFAIPYIKGEMLHFLRDRASTVRIPRRLQQLRNEGDKVSQALVAKLGRQPNELEIAAALNIDVEEWRAVKLSSINRAPMSLDARIQAGQQTESATTLGDTLMDAHSAFLQSCQEERLELQHALNQLEGKTREMIESVFLHQHSRQEVAARIGVSPVTVTRRIKKGIEELAEMLQIPSLAALVEG
ncbi:RNA polymerase sigma factor SigF [Altericista sp. CCNU0014]|uniref:RNA polymerase sigma factor SigF n=1 Tax=Altericista sp. CCNU0014 TaxID=3082949 RepID=UPI00384C60CB